MPKDEMPSGALVLLILRVHDDADGLPLRDQAR